MTVIEILLIILGFVFVGLSYLISTKSEEEKTVEQDHATKEVWSEKDEQLVKERIMEVVEEKVDEVVEHTTDRLNHISNEKIMAVDEFSNQVLEKIDQNHKEVIFMYNMLDEKEKELKKQPRKEVKKTAEKKPVKKETKKIERPKVSEESMADMTDINKKICELHQAGKSILEISKELNLGQGEVKLVVDLYGG